jgi:hypothetical protein
METPWFTNRMHRVARSGFRRGWTLVLVVATACSDGASRKSRDIFAQTPFANLEGVSFGMTAEALQHLRPAATFSPYSGLSERVGTVTLAYGFPPASTIGPSIDQSARLDLLMSVEPVASMDAGFVRLKMAMSDIEPLHEVPPTCFDVRGSSPGRKAVWNVSGVHLEVSVRDSVNIGPTTAPVRLVYLASRRPDMIAGQDAEKVPCGRFR